MHRRDGFSLVEMLLYTLFVAILMTSMVLLAYTVFTYQSKVRSMLMVDQDLRFAMQRIQSYIQSANGITTPTVGASSSTLVLSMTTSTLNPTTISLAGGIVSVTQGTSTAQGLTPSETTVSSLSFSRVSTTSAIIRVVLTGSVGSGTGSQTLTVTSTVSVPR